MTPIKQLSLVFLALGNLLFPAHLHAAADVAVAAEEIVIAVIDTGIDQNHSVLKPNIWKNPKKAHLYSQFGWDFVNNRPNPVDRNGHGTHVSGIIHSVLNSPEIPSA